MRVLFIQQDHVSPTGPVGEAFAEAGYDVAEFGVVPASRFHDPSVTVAFPDQLVAETAARSAEARLRAKRLVSAFLTLPGSA